MRKDLFQSERARGSAQRPRIGILVFALILVAMMVLLGTSVGRTNAFNNRRHHDVFSGAELFSPEEAKSGPVSVAAVPRSNTWTKVFNLTKAGIYDHDFQAYTYDFTVSNNTSDLVSDFTFRLVFSRDVFLASAWNGALEIHQSQDGVEHFETVPDMREFVPDDYGLESYTIEGEPFIFLRAGDSVVYIPNAGINAMEVPIKAHEGTTPGIILYVAAGESIEDSTLELDYRLFRPLKNEPLFWISLVGAALWLIALISFATTTHQIRKYKERHERDNEIINESIETFTGFIDAKDPYTHGHSKRVAVYTRLIAREMGFGGEELDRIYYVGLLHDCGKIGVPDVILSKPDRLTEAEYEIIKSHTVRGGEILCSFKSLEHADEGARFHHERYDGKGYPEGRRGEEIPLIARMICVADSFDAMNTNRVYRRRLTKARIIQEIETNRGLQFDPVIADIMLGLIRNGTIPVEE